MINIADLRIGNSIYNGNDIVLVYNLDSGGHTAHRINDIPINKNTGCSLGTGEIMFKPILITKEILRDKFEFAIHDLGDFWQCELDDFVLIQAKFQFTKGVEMPFVMRLKTTVPKSISFTEVHHLQNVYYFIQKTELVWK